MAALPLAMVASAQESTSPAPFYAVVPGCGVRRSAFPQKKCKKIITGFGILIPLYYISDLVL
ncbi:MAG: hypothetical protein H6628_04570 [Calditrichae bacterium]|nr:hypothetical protein [Calditrichia bacterium]